MFTLLVGRLLVGNVAARLPVSKLPASKLLSRRLPVGNRMTPHFVNAGRRGAHSVRLNFSVILGAI